MNHQNWFCNDRKDQFEMNNDCLSIGLDPLKKLELQQLGVNFDVYLDNNAGFLNIENLSKEMMIELI